MTATAGQVPDPVVEAALALVADLPPEDPRAVLALLCLEDDSGPS